MWKIKCLPSFIIVTNDFYSWVYPCRVYCVSVLASTYPTKWKRIVILQKKIPTLIAKKLSNTYTNPVRIFMYLFQIAKFMELNLVSNRANNQA